MDPQQLIPSRSQEQAPTDYKALLAFAVIAVALAAAGVLHYYLWDQVVYLWIRGCGLLCSTGQAHGYRYIVTLPGLQLGDWFGPRGQAVYVSLFVAANCWLWLRIMRRINDGRLFIGLGFIAVVGLQLAMNGRGVFGWTAWILTILFCCDLLAGRQIPTRRLLLLPAILLLASVSTGVFAVVFGTLGACFALYALRARSRAHTVTALAGLAIMALPFGGYFVLSFVKNLTYYGGVTRMLAHGLGGRFGYAEWLAIVLVAALAVAVVVIFLRPELARVSALILPALAGGVFGTTVLTLALVPALLVFDSLTSDFVRARMAPKMAT